MEWWFITLGLMVVGLALITFPLWDQRLVRSKRGPMEHNGLVGYIDGIPSDLPWAPFLGKRCKARLPRGKDKQFWGRCDLAEGHYNTFYENDHCLERGLIWVRWNDKGVVRYDQPDWRPR